VVGPVSHPGLRALEALAIDLPFFFLLFAGVYVVMATNSISNFGERLTHSLTEALAESLLFDQRRITPIVFRPASKRYFGFISWRVQNVSKA
jgi:hypothetical protein